MLLQHVVGVTSIGGVKIYKMRKSTEKREREREREKDMLLIMSLGDKSDCVE